MINKIGQFKKLKRDLQQIKHYHKLYWLSTTLASYKKLTIKLKADKKVLASIPWLFNKNLVSDESKDEKKFRVNEYQSN
jgi:hypothetical protein